MAISCTGLKGKAHAYIPGDLEKDERTLSAILNQKGSSYCSTCEQIILVNCLETLAETAAKKTGSRKYEVFRYLKSPIKEEGADYVRTVAWNLQEYIRTRAIAISSEIRIEACLDSFLKELNYYLGMEDRIKDSIEQAKNISSACVSSTLTQNPLLASEVSFEELLAFSARNSTEKTTSIPNALEKEVSSFVLKNGKDDQKFLSLALYVASYKKSIIIYEFPKLTNYVIFYFSIPAKREVLKEVDEKRLRKGQRLIIPSLLRVFCQNGYDCFKLLEEEFPKIRESILCPSLNTSSLLDIFCAYSYKTDESFIKPLFFQLINRMYLYYDQLSSEQIKWFLQSLDQFEKKEECLQGKYLEKWQFIQERIRRIEELDVLLRHFRL